MVGVSGQEVACVRSSDGALAFEEHGPPHGKPVVCVHGLTANRSTWRAVARQVEDDLRLVLVDLLARGQSESLRGGRYDLESEASRLSEFVAGLGMKRPILAGHSHGAAVAFAAATRVQARGLLLVNPVVPGLPRPIATRLLAIPGLSGSAAWMARYFRVPLTRYTLVRRVFTGRAGMPMDAVARYAEPWADARRTRCLVSILASWDPGELATVSTCPKVPTVVVAGRCDRRIPEALARAWAMKLGARLQVLEDCGHAAPEEAPAAVGGALRAVADWAHEVRPEDEDPGQGDLR